MSANDYYGLCEKPGKRIGWDFSHLKPREESREWNFPRKFLKS